MKKMLSFTIIIIFLFCFSGCGHAQTESNSVSSATGNGTVSAGNSEDTENIKNTKNTVQNSEFQSQENANTKEAGNHVLIAYFSREDENYGVGVIEKGNTEIVAEIIAEQTGGSLFEISTVEEYPKGYEECTEVAKQEQEENVRPVLLASVENMDTYDVIYLGYPIWWGDCPMAIYTFLESYDLSDKTIIPFCTHAGSGISGTVNNIQNACPDSKVLTGFDIEGETAQNDYNETKQQLTEWLNE